jgi:hypothetical protein
MGGRPSPSYKSLQNRIAQSLQAFLTQVSGADLEGTEAKAVGAFLRIVHDEASLDQHPEQVIGTRSRQPQPGRHHRGRQRLGGTGQFPKDGKPGRQGWGARGHPSNYLRSETAGDPQLWRIAGNPATMAL